MLRAPRGLAVRSRRPGRRHPGHGRLLSLAGQPAGGLRLPRGGGESKPQALRGSVPRGGRGDDTDTHGHTRHVIGVLASLPLGMIIYLLRLYPRGVVTVVLASNRHAQRRS